MDQMIEDASTFQQYDGSVEGFMTCACCGAILGYKVRLDRALWLYVYAYAPRAVAPGLPKRRVNARILEGDVHCPHCGTWQRWEIPLPGKCAV